jgi:hypothetical protein
MLNPGFETATSGNYLKPWTWTQASGGAFAQATGTLSDPSGGTAVYKNEDQKSGARAFKGVIASGASNTNKLSTLTLVQGGIDLPKGTMIKVSTNVKILRDGINQDNAPLTVSLKFDDVVVGTLSPKSNDKNKWFTIMNTFAVTQSQPHTISLEVVTKGKSGDIFSVDDFSITAVSPPAGSKFCPRP